MLAARLITVNDLKVEHVPTPSAGRGEVLVEVGANTICGTDLRIIRGDKTSYVELPVILGHEAAGRVVEVGEGVDRYAPGDRVALNPGIPDRRCWACRHDLENVCEHKRIVGYSVDGGLAQYMLVPAESVDAGSLFVAESNLPYEQLALAEPLGCVVNGQRLTPAGVGDTVLIMGAGPIGLMHLQLVLLSGAGAVIVSQRSPARRALAERLGATVAVDPTSQDLAEVVDEITGGRGVDLAIIAIGVPELVNEALRLTRVGGRVNIFAGLAGKGWAEVEANLIHYRQLMVTGSSDVRRSDYEAALDLITSERVDTASLVTHRFPLQDVAGAFATAAGREAVKVAVLPNVERTT
jgi:L-iditol 2-dehydrogenase